MSTALIITLLKLAGGPALVFILRKVAPVFLKKAPGALQPVLASIINVVIAISTGADPVMSLAALVEAVQYFVGTLGVVKTADLFTGNSNTVNDNEKDIIRRMA